MTTIWQERHRNIDNWLPLTTVHSYKKSYRSVDNSATAPALGVGCEMKHYMPFQGSLLDENTWSLYKYVIMSSRIRWWFLYFNLWWLPYTCGDGAKPSAAPHKVLFLGLTNSAYDVIRAKSDLQHSWERSDLTPVMWRSNEEHEEGRKNYTW